eukprot:1450155-Pyramimonas_sp.AAC.1
MVLLLLPRAPAAPSRHSWGRNDGVIAWYESARAGDDPAAGLGGASSRMVGRAQADPRPPPACVVRCCAEP